MIELILTIILLISLAGLAVILFKKMPILAELPEVSGSRGQEPLIAKLRSQIKNLPGKDTIDYEMYLQRALSRIRVLTLKTEQKTGSWLERLRQKSKEKRDNNRDDYWEKLKKAKDGK